MMNHGLPQIVDSRQSLTEDIRKIDKVQVEELTRLWKVYTTNKNIMATGRRLENLFWRIWGSDRIQENISGSTVAKIFLMIDAGEKAIQNQAYRIPPPPTSVIKQVPIDISVPPTPPPSPFSAFSPSSNQPSQTALSASLLQAYPNTPPSPMMPPKVPPPSPVVLSDHPVRPPLTRVHQSYPLSTNDEQVQIGRELVSSKAVTNSGRHRRRNVPGILRSSKSDGKRRMGPPTISRTTSNSSNATASSGISTPMTSITEISNMQDASKNGKDTDETSNSFLSGPSAGSSSRKGSMSEAGSAKSKEDWLVEPDFRAKYIEQRKKDRLSAIAGNPIVKGPLKTGATIATAPMTALATPRTKKGRGRNILVVDSVVPLKSPDDSGTIAKVVETTSAPISEIMPGLVEKETFEKPPMFQRTKSQLSLMIEQAKRNSDGGLLDEDAAHPSISERDGSPEVIPEKNVQSDDGFEDEEEDDKPLEMRQRPPSKLKSSKTKRPKFRSRKS
ncbi:hypothetical protein TWF696_001742 [Orbilia brochopaga]|uniref:Nitrogen regulatory protein areA GATA-like domain-containing protein n=1 Tax=Orbilia brochopaga TaxID=3140254 RepID=A0AAV9U8T5_9PEZI